jgi:putative RNA 2'-phosphotransferase
MAIMARAVKTMDTTKYSKRLSWLLRHGAAEAGVEMDAAGWAQIEHVLAALKMSRTVLDQVVRENNKSRFEIEGEKIRACQGHSTGGTTVSLEALEASWNRWLDDGSLWHGTSVGAAHSIASTGIQPRKRTHVHLARAIDSVVGKRAGVDVLLEVSPSRLRAKGLTVFESTNGVILVREVPAGCIVGVQAMTRAGQRAEERLRQLFGP